MIWSVAAALTGFCPEAAPIDINNKLHDNEISIHRYAGPFIAASHIVLLRGECEWKKSLHAAMRRVPRSRNQRNRAVGE
jgi:hypothetical protein